jgi:hypothetical protein
MSKYDGRMYGTIAAEKEYKRHHKEQFIHRYQLRDYD